MSEKICEDCGHLARNHQICAVDYCSCTSTFEVEEHSLVLTVVDFGDSCAVRVDEGSNAFEGVPCSDVDGSGLWSLDSEDVWCTWRPFTKLREVIDQQADCSGGTWKQMAIGSQSKHNGMPDIWRYIRK